MNTPQANPSKTDRVESPQRALRRLFLTLFLRGSSSRGLQRDKVPRSIATKLPTTLAMYVLVGLLALAFGRLSVFALSVYLHAMTFAFLGMFVAASAGEILFNREEADILLHRPVTPQALLWAKVRVLVEVSLWLAFAFNLAGFYVGLTKSDGGWMFLPAHAFSLALEALFSTGAIVLIYQLCLRWCGRERLENLMTAAQIFVSVGVVLAGQILPRMIMRPDGQPMDVGQESWWMATIPPAWFAGIDDLLVAGFSPRSALLAFVALAATGGVSWMAFSRLAGSYETGLQTLGETPSRRGTAGRRWLERLTDLPPLRWCLRDPVTRASFLLTAAYLVRDRDVKLRVYPGLAPLMMMPLMMLLPMRQNPNAGGFPVAMCGAWIGLTPMFAITILQFSQQWQAADVFRSAPLAGPAAICAGARQAVLWLLSVPTMIVVLSLTWLVSGRAAELPLLLPGILALPVNSMLANLGGAGIPLSQPTEQAKSAMRGLSLYLVMIFSMLMAGVATFCWWSGYFWLLLAVEAIAVVVLFKILKDRVARAPWPTSE